MYPLSHSLFGDVSGEISREDLRLGRNREWSIRFQVRCRSLDIYRCISKGKTKGMSRSRLSDADASSSSSRLDINTDQDANTAVGVAVGGNYKQETSHRTRLEQEVVMYATNSTSSYQLWNERSSHIHRRSQLHFPGICSVKQRQLSANHGLFLLKPYNEKHIKPADNKGLNVGNEIHQLASSGFGPPQGSNPVWDVFFTILLPFVQAIFCWGPSQILKQLGGLNPVDKAVETAERGAELVKDVANKVGDTAVETAEKGSKLVKDVADKVGDTAVGATDLGIKVVEDVAGKVEDRTEKNVELGTRAVKIVAGKVVDGTGQTIEVVENIGENVEGVADDIVEKLPVDGTLKDTVKGVEGIAKGATKDIRKIFGRGRL